MLFRLVKMPTMIGIQTVDILIKIETMRRTIRNMHGAVAYTLNQLPGKIMITR